MRQLAISALTAAFALILAGCCTAKAQTRSEEARALETQVAVEAPANESAGANSVVVGTGSGDVDVEIEVVEPDDGTVADRALEGAQHDSSEIAVEATQPVTATIRDINTDAVTAAVGAVVPYPVELWDGIVSMYATSDGGFRYDALRQAEAHRAVLDEFIAALASASPDSWSRDQQLAFYINAYNALTIRSVLELWPVTSVLSERGFFDRRTHTVAGAEMTLNDLENDIIRAQFNDPRIHFVVNCASTGCPWLQPYAFTATNIQQALDQHTREYLARTLVQQSDRSRMEVSSIFDWFADDFEVVGGVRAFIATHLDGEAQAYVSDTGNRIRFFEYDWSLNGR